jgi:predicted LPLAT superfamily acyltransferase
MSIRACFVLPVLDPGPALERTVAALLPYGLPLYLTDDGSGAGTRAQLERLQAREPLIRLNRLDVNRGKGAAVMDGFRRAARDGCSHAFQVDADHQHDCGAAAGFLALAEARPDAVIAGVPRYDASVPLARKHWRRFNHLWVHINTLSMAIGDSLCGFRIYPLEPTLRLMGRVAIPKRMDFDTEIIIRLHWAGVPVLNRPVAVTYPPDGVSHYRLGADTLRLIWMHIRLLGGMFRRAPRLLAGPGRPWHRIRERGGEFGFRCAFWGHRLLGARALRPISELAALYFLLTSPCARRASRAYLSRLRAASGPLPELPGEPGWPEVYRHFRAFTRATLDKFLAWSGSAGSASCPDLEALLAARRGGKGALFLGAHLGNLDMLRALGAARGLTGLNAVVFSENAARFHALLRRANPDFGIDLVQISAVSPATAIFLQEKIDRGESLFIMGDRIPPRSAGGSVTVPFLGAEAAFPVGPYILAHLLGCPVYTVFCCRAGGRYRVHVQALAERVALPRANREAALKDWASRYALTLEARCRETPFEWFNYYDFWHSHASLG